MNRQVRSAGLVMSSVPKGCRDEFVEFAEEQFADNYASCFKFVWENFKLWQQVMYNQDMKLNHIINQIEQLLPGIQEEERNTRNPGESEIKALDGRTIKIKRRQNE